MRFLISFLSFAFANQIVRLIGKTSGLDHSWPDNIEHLEPELSICCLAMHENCNLPGEKWSISPAFALEEQTSKIGIMNILDNFRLNNEKKDFQSVI